MRDIGHDDRERSRLAEGKEEKGNAHIAGVRKRRGERMEGKGSDAARKQKARDDEGNAEDKEDAAEIGGDQRPIQDSIQRRLGEAMDEQRGQGDPIDESVERLGTGWPEQPDTPDGVANQDDPEDREDDAEDGFHRGWRLSRVSGGDMQPAGRSRCAIAPRPRPA